MKGRPADWSAALAEAPPQDVLESAAAAGFEGLWIDRAGYVDHGQSLEAQVARLTHEQPLVSENGRLAFYDLRPYERELRARAGAGAVAALGNATLHPVNVAYAAGFYGPESAGGSTFRWMNANGAIDLHSPKAGREVVVSARLSSGRPGTTTIRWPDGSEQRLRTGESPVEVRRTLRLAYGPNRVTLSTDSPGPRAPGDPRRLRLQVADLVVTDPAAVPALLTR
jgi:phosphoglycerol transferase